MGKLTSPDEWLAAISREKGNPSIDWIRGIQAEAIAHGRAAGRREGLEDVLGKTRELHVSTPLHDIFGDQEAVEIYHAGQEYGQRECVKIIRARLEEQDNE